MHSCNAGEILPRLLPRLRPSAGPPGRRRTFLKRRHPTWPPPVRPAAAARCEPVSAARPSPPPPAAPPAWRPSPPRPGLVHARSAPQSVPGLSNPPHAAPAAAASLALRPAVPRPLRPARPQAQPPARRSAAGSPRPPRAAPRGRAPRRANVGPHAPRPSRPLLHAAAAAPGPAPSPPPAQHRPAAQAAPRQLRQRPVAALDLARPAQRRRTGGHASARPATARAQAEVHSGGRFASSRAEGEEEPHLEADCRILPGQELGNPAGAVLHQAQGQNNRLDRRYGPETPQCHAGVRERQMAHHLCEGRQWLFASSMSR